MKFIKFFPIIVALFYGVSLFGQSQTELLNGIKTSNMAVVETFLKEKIDFCIFEDQQFLPKSVAMKKMKDFLDKNKPVSIEVMHNGNSKDKSSQYTVAKLVTSQGSYRIFIYAEGEIKAGSVKEIRIDKF
ncbi:MAG: DUF4783 domain-containing protein [Saprospiraceae bacterium]|nr:DUF4783 domain-containing protein [Saprospiraceae bacterium]